MIIDIALLAFVLVAIKTLIPVKVKSAGFTSASASLSNPRFSYRAGIASGAINTPTVTIDTSANADNNTNHLFPKDVVCFTGAETGCTGNKSYTVANITTANTFTFNLTTNLTDNLDTSGYVIASQSGTLTLTFTTASQIPSNGNILVTIPSVNTTGKTNDGIPDTNATTGTNGFDIGAMATSDVAVTGCTDLNWTVASITPGTSSADTTILINRSSTACAASSAMTITIGTVTHPLINPAPLTTHTQGQADTYQINVQSRDNGNNTLDSSDLPVAPVEGVLVSATVDETLSLTIAGVTADTGSYCGITRTASTPDTTATSVPWGTIPSTYASATHNTDQQATVSTNANAGYYLYVEENDQMGKDGNVCTGTSPSAGDFTFSAGKCIRDTVCGSTPCSESSQQDWTDMATYVGLGYSLQNASGTDATFLYNTGGTFQTRQFADVTEGGETRQSIMHNTGPVSGSSVYVCYRIAISPLQPAGYYYNKLKYTAVATF